MNIIPAPVEFTAAKIRSHQRALWATLCALTAIALVAQIAYFKFSELSRVEPYRTAYLYICPVFRCKLPTLEDRHQIQVNNLVVRLNPDIENALLVDATLLNVAPFEQPFPNIFLAFSTVDDVPVAARLFTPKEYLSGEMAGRTHIPRNQPVHITLELVDPGPLAVNYALTIP